MHKQYVVLDPTGNPIAREGDEASPLFFVSVMEACVFAEEQKKNYESVTLAELIILDTQPGDKK